MSKSTVSTYGPTWEQLTDEGKQAVDNLFRIVLRLRREGKIGRKPCTK